MKNFGLSRDIPVDKLHAALLFIDVQNYTMEGGGEYAGLAPDIVEQRHGYFFREMRTRAIPNMQRLQRVCRERAASCSHHHRPERGSSPGATARVHGAQPMLGKPRSCRP